MVLLRAAIDGDAIPDRPHVVRAPPAFPVPGCAPEPLSRPTARGTSCFPLGYSMIGITRRGGRVIPVAASVAGLPAQIRHVGPAILGAVVGRHAAAAAAASAAEQAPEDRSDRGRGRSWLGSRSGSWSWSWSRSRSRSAAGVTRPAAGGGPVAVMAIARTVVGMAAVAAIAAAIVAAIVRAGVRSGRAAGRSVVARHGAEGAAGLGCPGSGLATGRRPALRQGRGHDQRKRSRDQ